MKKSLSVLGLATLLSVSSVEATSKSLNASLCQDNTRNRITIIIQGDGGTSTQGTLVLCNGKSQEFTSRVTTGRPQSDGGVWTPEGTFRVGELNANRVSRKYNSPMPYAIHVYRGIFIHQGNVGGNRSSHGCIRLPDGKANTLFEMVKNYRQRGKNISVIIRDTNPNE